MSSASKLRARARKIKQNAKKNELRPSYPNRKFWANDGLVDWREWPQDLKRDALRFLEVGDECLKKARRDKPADPVHAAIAADPDSLVLLLDLRSADERDLKIIGHDWLDARGKLGEIVIGVAKADDVRGWLKGLPVPHGILTAPLADEVLWCQVGNPNCEIFPVRLRASLSTFPHAGAA